MNDNLLAAENIELKNAVETLTQKNNRLNARIQELINSGATNQDTSKEKAQLLYKIQKCKIELKKQELKKTGKTNKYDYFELSDFVPQLERILYENKLGSYFTIKNKKAVLTVFDSVTGVSHNWVTECIYSSQIKENGYDVGVHMKSEQAIQTYARRTLYLQAFDILEPNEIESQDKTINKQVKPKKQSWQNTLKPQKQEPEEVTAERVQEIIGEAYEMMKDHYGKDEFEFSWEKAKRTIKRLCKNEHEYNICKQHTVFKTANTIKGGMN